MNRSTYFLSQCLTTPWAMDPTAMAAYAAILAGGYARRMGVAAGGMDEDDHGAPLKPEARAGRDSGRQGSIAVINVFGAIVQRASQLGPCEGGIGAEDIGQALNMALADETVSQILMRFDSPGGSVFGVGELGAQIYAARSQKPIVGIADSLSASAAYWLLSQCSEAYCTPGGQVGSIGVYGAHEDISKALDEAGIKVTLVSAGKYKVEGAPFSPLDDDAKAYMQQSIDGYYSQFTKAVAKGRGVGIDQVRDGMGQGRVLPADAAQAAGMIDGVATFGDVVKKMAKSQQARQGRSALAAAQNTLALTA